MPLHLSNLLEFHSSWCPLEWCPFSGCFQVSFLKDLRPFGEDAFSKGPFLRHRERERDRDRDRESRESRESREVEKERSREAEVGIVQKVFSPKGVARIFDAILTQS